MTKPTPPGSSPLARGTLKPDLDKLTRAGLIPARAGNTVFVLSHWWVLRAHPRSRGEHHLQMLPAFYGEGSSPLARGTQ